MKTRLPKRSILFASVLLFVVGGLSLVCFLWVKAAQRQYILNRQLIEALHERDLNHAQKLVEVGADPNTRIKPMPAPTWSELLNQLLHHSSFSMHDSPTAFMAVCGADWNEYSVNLTLIMDDAQLTQVAQIMLAHGANVNAQDASEETALMHASQFGHIGRVTLLLKYGADIDLQDNEGNTALGYAAWTGETQTVEMLLKHHANPNLKSKHGTTPLTNAYQQANFPAKSEIIRLLKQAGATE